METKEGTLKNTHHGHAIKRIRHTLGIKQEVLADMMGTTQARISNCEQKKELEDEVIDKFAKALNVAPELIRELEEDPVKIILLRKAVWLAFIMLVIFIITLTLLTG